MVAPLQIGGGITFGGGISVSAASSGPTVPTFTYSGTSQVYTQGTITMTPDGLTAYIPQPGGFTIHKATLGASYDLTSFTVDASDSYPVDFSVNHTGTLAFNADGTKAITVLLIGSPTVCTYNLATPYDMSTITGSYTPSSSPLTLQTGATSMFFADGGMKGYIMDGSLMSQWNLNSPYDINSFSGAAVATFNPTTAFSLNSFGQPQQFCLNATGTLGYLSSLGNSYNGDLTQFSLATPFDISTSQTPQIADVTGFGQYGTYYGIAINPAGNRILVQGPGGSGASLFQFNGS